MNKKIHVHVPYLRLFENMEYLLRERINPEIYFSSEALDTYTYEHLSSSARLLRDAGLATTIHAAFMDLNPGAVDSTIREATRKRFEQVFQAAVILRPRVIVVHPGLDEVRHGNDRAPWLENSILFWRNFLPRAIDINCAIAVENIFEKEPSSLRDLLEAIDNPAFRHCFDVGHWNMFANIGLEEWLTELGSFIAEIHLHDNHGQADEHLPLGEGQIDFDLLFQLMGRFAPEAVWTIEAHTNERRERALKNIEKYL